MSYRLKYFNLITTTVLLSLPLGAIAATPTANAPPKARNLDSVAISLLKGKEDADRLFQQGVEQFRSGSFENALQTYQQVLIMRSSLGDRLGVAATLDNIGETYIGLGDFNNALEKFQEALGIRSELNDRQGIGETLNNIGIVYHRLSDYAQALDFHQRALDIAKTLNDPAIEAEALHNIAAVSVATGDNDRAIELYQQALTLRQQVGDKRDESRTLNNLGGVYFSLGDSDRAFEFYQQALELRQEIGDEAGVARLLSNFGLLYYQLGQTDRALNYYEQALPILKKIGDRFSLGSTLNSIGAVYENLGDYNKAIEIYQESLNLAREIGDRAGLGKTLDNVAGIYYSLGQYPKALESYEQALKLRQEIGDRPGVGNTLTNLGGIYLNLGQYPQALEVLNQALTIRQEVGDLVGESRTLDAIGIIYQEQGQYSQALDSYQKALEIARSTRNKMGEANALEHLGGVYNLLDRSSEGLQLLQQAVAKFKELGDRAAVGRSLNGIAGVYYRWRQYPQALEFLQQSRKILQELGDKAGEAIALANIGRVLHSQDQSLLAIVFYKEAVNLNESIRQELRVFSFERQQAFTDTIAQTYRNLADLLLQQNRRQEAHHILDLLKVQELHEYLQNVRGNERTASGVELSPEEQKLAEKYALLQEGSIQIWQELNQLAVIPDSERTPEQEQRIEELEEALQELRQKFNDFVESPEIAEIEADLAHRTGGESLDLNHLQTVQRALQQLPKNAVILYPLILENRLELVLITPDTPPIYRSVPVSAATLQQTISEFRTALTVPSRRANIELPKAAGHQLYNWLIEPIQTELDRLQVETIIYAPDGQLRYIPLAALYDGEQWLVQRYGVNNITATSLTNFTDRPSNQLHILAGAFTQGTYNVEVGTRQVAFSGLPFAAKEVENLANTIPGTTTLLDRAFNREAMVSALSDSNIIHLATHGTFVSGQPEDSFILLGDGDRITFRDLESWSLNNIDLIVLSACQTALGGEMGNGREILGFGYQMQQAGAKTAIASLWSVDDGGTQALMDAFYESLKTGVGKTEALQQAQLALIDSDYNHPYYWASFILIGNGF